MLAFFNMQMTKHQSPVTALQATNLRKKEATELALEHFDQFYSPVYGKLWPSIHVALLSSQKYCALVNNFHATPESVMTTLEARGAYNILTRLNQNYHADDTVNLLRETETTESEPKDKSVHSKACYDDYHEYKFPDMKAEVLEQELGPRMGTIAISCEDEEINRFESAKSGTGEVNQQVLEQDLNASFVPAQKIHSEKQLQREQEITQSIYEPHDIQVQIVPDVHRYVPHHLKVFVHPQGDVSDFPEPKPDKTGILEYYLMDAASVLPVVALNPSPSDTILDMCAAPGGKTLCMLQTLTTGDIVANDSSPSRLRRLSGVLQWYCPQANSEVIKSQRKGQAFGKPLFDKVLVDVPCSTDRHVLMSEENNLFRPGRIADRLQMITTQKELLLAGVKSCKPGGTIVYSTCTLSPTQNDGVIQAAVEELWNFTSIDVAVENISWISSAFSNTFRFFQNCRFGQLVLPTLRANFGPMYICKIKRLK